MISSEDAKFALARQQVLDKIASGESPGYNVLYGGETFSGFADHPRKKIPLDDGNYSSAAGRYQFIAPTWDEQAKRLGLKDFSPANQDLAAWDLAARTYGNKTGRALLDDVWSGKVEWSALGDVWVSLQEEAEGPGPGALGESPGNSLGGQMSAPATPASPPLDLPAVLKLFENKFEFTPVDYDPFAVLDQMTGASDGK